MSDNDDGRARADDARIATLLATIFSDNARLDKCTVILCSSRVDKVEVMKATSYVRVVLRRLTDMLERVGVWPPEDA